MPYRFVAFRLGMGRRQAGHGQNIAKSSTACSGYCVQVPHGVIYLNVTAHGKPFITVSIDGQSLELLTLFLISYFHFLMLMDLLTGQPLRWMAAISVRSNVRLALKKTSRYYQR